MRTIGQLWINKSKKGQKYGRGTIEVVAGAPTKILLFPNDKKDNPKAPDFKLLLQEDQEEIKEVEGNELF